MMTVDPRLQAERPDGDTPGRVHPLLASKSLFLAAAGLSFLLSVGLWFTGDRERGLFVGLWVPSILSAGALLLGGGRHDE